nr:retrovirus-related Pol polyprotein from transposon TNT 1-94 [Tanacetum cinerariifolium]
MFEIYIQDQVQGQRFRRRLLKIQVAQKKVKIAFEISDSSLRVELIPSKIKMCYKVVLNFHKEFLVFSSLKEKEMMDYFRITCSSIRKKSSLKIPNENILRQNLMKAEQERDDLKLKLEKFQTSSKILGDGYHVVPPPYTRTFMPPKPDFVFHNAPTNNETVHTAFNVKLSLTKPDNDLSYTYRPSTPIIEDWVSDFEDESETKIPQNVPSFVQPIEQVKSFRPSIQYVETSIPTANPKIAIPKPKTVITKSKLVPINAARPVTAVVLKPHVTRPRQAKPIVTKPHSPHRRHINRSPSPKASSFPPKVTVVKVSQVNVAKGVKEKWEWKPKCLILDHVSWNMSYLSNFEELNGGYVAFCGNPKGGTISGTDDYSRFTRVFFLATKDENSPILKTFITGIENQLSLKVKIIKSDNGTEFKNNNLNQFCGMKGIKKKFSVPRTPQQNGIAERKNKTLIEAARTILADSLLPIPFWAEAVNTTCYVQNRVLVTKPQNKTPYELLLGRTPSIGFMRPFGYPVTILNTLDPLGKFDGKVDEEFLVGYSVSSKAFRVFNNRT